MGAKELKEELLKVSKDIDALLAEIKEDNTKQAEQAKLSKEAQENKEASDEEKSLNMGTLGDTPSKGTNPLLDFIFS